MCAWIKRTALLVGLLLLPVGVLAQQQSAPRRCTDLSGKIEIKCPPDGTPAVQPRSTAESEQTAERGTISTRHEAVQGTFSPERQAARQLLDDQKSIWTRPLHLTFDDSRWIFPIAAGATVLVMSDADIERKLPSDPSVIRQAKHISDYGVFAYGAALGSGYLWSRISGNEHLRETTVFGFEAVADTLAVTEALKFVTGRARPYEGDHTGAFLTGSSSFPSEHSAAAWAIASVVAREYPSPFVSFLAYGGAAAMTASRVVSRQHFVSDAVVGSAIGWFVGRQVARARTEGRDNSIYGTFYRSERADRTPDPAFMGSAYVPLDSWIYPAIERLAALGYVDSAFLGQRPWTRMECARLVDEANTKINYDEPGDRTVAQLLSTLRSEFAPETRRWAGADNVGVTLESVYGRATEISGRPLSDGYHVGQTIVNDYGRPYAEGLNSVTGVSGHAVAGPLVFYLRAEYQHAPTPALNSLPIQQSISNLDGVPFIARMRAFSTDRVRLLDSYVGINLHNYLITAGKQSLWLGPGENGPLSFSNNAEPIPMLRISRSTPVTLPSLFKYLGPTRAEFFIGRLSGHQFIMTSTASGRNALDEQFIGPPLISQPYVDGQKISFKPTPNFEFGVSSTAVFGGPDFPLTWKTFVKSFADMANAPPGSPLDPGDRRTGFDFSYRIPKLRNRLILYNDSMAEDEISPLGYPRRSAMNPGIYLPQLPYLHKVDLRVEAAYTDLPNLRPDKGFYYFNAHYRNGYTNNGMLLGDWVGREGTGIQASSTIWFTATNTLRLLYRHQGISKGFLPDGGSIDDAVMAGDFGWRNTVRIAPRLQFESWSVPLLAGQTQRVVIGSIQITYYPKWRIER